MFEMGNFQRGPDNAPKVDTYSEIPKEMDVFQQSEASFLPEGKTFEDLSEKELARLRAKYRFRYFKPGKYQSITWKKSNNNNNL